MFSWGLRVFVLISYSWVSHMYCKFYEKGVLAFGNPGTHQHHLWTDNGNHDNILDNKTLKRKSNFSVCNIYITLFWLTMSAEKLCNATCDNIKLNALSNMKYNNLSSKLCSFTNFAWSKQIWWVPELSNKLEMPVSVLNEVFKPATKCTTFTRKSAKHLMRV